MKDSLGRLHTGALFGGSSDIGRAILAALRWQDGAQLWLAGRREPTRAVALPAHVTSRWVPWDAQRPADGPAVLDAITADIDVIVVAVGVLGATGEQAFDPAPALHVLSTNLIGSAAVLLPAAERLRRQGHGTLIVLSSIAAVPVRADNFVYGASKAGLDGLALGLADSLTGSGATVLVVRPGFVRTKMTAGMTAAPFATTPQAVAERVAAAAAAGRSGVVWAPAALRAVSIAMRLTPRPLLRRLAPTPPRDD